MIRGFVGPLAWLAIGASLAAGAERVPIRIERHRPDAPVVFGLPLPRGAALSPDHIRVVDTEGREIVAQVTEVATWEPVDPSLKWVWIFFFAPRADHVFVEIGPDVRRRQPQSSFQIVNNQRPRGLLEVTTGALRFVVRQGPGGFLHQVQLDLGGDGFEADDVVAKGPEHRGSFVDLLDDAGPDHSRAVVEQTYIERGSGPLHAILRVEGHYEYGREDHPQAPFVTRIHAYADRSYLRVLHSFVYTGVPDKHRPLEGEYAHLATQADRIVELDESDPGWAVPDERILEAGLRLEPQLRGGGSVRTALLDGAWWRPGDSRIVETDVAGRVVGIRQTGQKPDRQPPVPVSSGERRLDGFRADVMVGESSVADAERAAGWFDVKDDRWGIAVGVRHMLEEYPKAVRFDPSAGGLEALVWDGAAGPLSFARWSSERGREAAIENWAQGMAKTSELLFFFHPGDTDAREVGELMDGFMSPPIAHADPAWYGQMDVFGHFSPRRSDLTGLERALDHKIDWTLFNQHWEPWYGMFDYGDVKVNFDGERWANWAHNEPAEDFILWLQFMRTGDPRVFDAAQAMSRHTMDVDNTHWPNGGRFEGTTNQPLDYWRGLEADATASPYLGMGRRHSRQHWAHALTAHVWVQGWLADYYLAADHRALDVARMTADLHMRRPWGEHGLTGRRLYLSVWNLVCVWDATKDPRYREELEDRIGRMLRLQERQSGSLVMDRYGYAHIYASHGLSRYLAATGDDTVRRALLRHARWARDVPSLNHWMESYLSALHVLALAHELTGEASFLEAIERRVRLLETDALPRPIDAEWTRSALFEAIEAADHMPGDPARFRPDLSDPEARRRSRRAGWAATNGLRVFGWTHAYGLPWALERLRTARDEPAGRR